MIELWKVVETASKIEQFELVTSMVKWEGERYKAARKITADIIVKQGSETYYGVEEGDMVIFKWKGKELFRGTVFGRVPKDGKLFFVAYDMLHYLVKNKDVYVFSNQRADQILRRMCNDFQIPMTTLANTGYTLKSLVFANDTSLYDMTLRALKETRGQTSRNYQLYSEKGKLGLRRWPDPDEVWVIEDGDKGNLLNYEYSTSIEESATRVKVRMQKDDKVFTATARDDAGARKFGVLQHVETVTDELNQAQLQQRANVRQSQMKGVKSKLDSVQAVGIPDLQSGLPVHIRISELNIKKNYWIDVDSHTFYGSSHQMQLNLVEVNTIPEGES